MKARLQEQFPNADIKVSEQQGDMARIHIDGADAPGKFKFEIQIGPKDVTNFYDGPIMKDGKPLTVDGKLVTVHDNMYKDLR
jgi:hypothetical protein